MNEQQESGSGRGWRGRSHGWDPMGELQSLRADLARLVGGRSGPPEVELTETADGWEVVVRLPGVAPEEVAVELDDRELCVRARSEAEVNADHGIPGGMETRGFEYRLDLPSRVDPDAIDAVMDHGLLRVRVPRASRPAPRTITVGPPAPGSRPASSGRSTDGQGRSTGEGGRNTGLGASTGQGKGTDQGRNTGQGKDTDQGRSTGQGKGTDQGKGAGEGAGHDRGGSADRGTGAVDPAADRELHHPDVSAGSVRRGTNPETGESANGRSAAGSGGGSARQPGGGGGPAGRPGAGGGPAGRPDRSGETDRP